MIEGIFVSYQVSGALSEGWKSTSSLQIRNLLTKDIAPYLRDGCDNS